MIPEAREVHLSQKDRKVLEACCRSPVSLQHDLKRARIVLLAADGRSTRSIAKEVGVQPRIVSLWRHRYADHGLEGLPQEERAWLEAHPNVQFHFTPTSASWLNQVEVWFSILQGQSLSGTSFTSLKQLQEHIDAYINACNDKAEPFVWTKKKVRQRRFKGRRITQL